MAMTIPSSVIHIDSGAFADCLCLRMVEFELPSECWCVSAAAFPNCPLLEPISLPSSVEFIGCDRIDIWTDRFPLVLNGLDFLIQDDCLVRRNGGEVIRYLGSSDTFCVGREIAVLATGSFRNIASLGTLDFEHPSRITHLVHHPFSYSRIRFVTIPKSVRLIGEGCFDSCTELTKVVFESPATIQRIEALAFSECPSLISFTVPSSVSILEDSVWSGCSKLSSGIRYSLTCNEYLRSPFQSLQ
jgi:hypothetical protein